MANTGQRTPKELEKCVHQALCEHSDFFINDERVQFPDQEHILLEGGKLSNDDIQYNVDKLNIQMEGLEESMVDRMLNTLKQRREQHMEMRENILALKNHAISDSEEGRADGFYEPDITGDGSEDDGKLTFDYLYRQMIPRSCPRLLEFEKARKRGLPCKMSSDTRIEMYFVDEIGACAHTQIYAILDRLVSELQDLDIKCVATSHPYVNPDMAGGMKTTGIHTEVAVEPLIIKGTANSKLAIKKLLNFDIEETFAPDKMSIIFLFVESVNLFSDDTKYGKTISNYQTFYPNQNLPISKDETATLNNLAMSGMDGAGGYSSEESVTNKFDTVIPTLVNGIVGSSSSLATGLSAEGIDPDSTNFVLSTKGSEAKTSNIFKRGTTIEVEKTLYSKYIQDLNELAMSFRRQPNSFTIVHKSNLKFNFLENCKGFYVLLSLMEPKEAFRFMLKMFVMVGCVRLFSQNAETREDQPKNNKNAQGKVTFGHGTIFKPYEHGATNSIISRKDHKCMDMDVCNKKRGRMMPGDRAMLAEECHLPITVGDDKIDPLSLCKREVCSSSYFRCALHELVCSSNFPVKTRLENTLNFTKDMAVGIASKSLLNQKKISYSGCQELLQEKLITKIGVNLDEAKTFIDKMVLKKSDDLIKYAKNNKMTARAVALLPMRFVFHYNWCYKELINAYRRYMRPDRQERLEWIRKLMELYTSPTYTQLRQIAKGLFDWSWEGGDAIFETLYPDISKFDKKSLTVENMATVKTSSEDLFVARNNATITTRINMSSIISKTSMPVGFSAMKSTTGWQVKKCMEANMATMLTSEQQPISNDQTKMIQDFYFRQTNGSSPSTYENGPSSTSGGGIFANESFAGLDSLFGAGPVTTKTKSSTKSITGQHQASIKMIIERHNKRIKKDKEEEDEEEEEEEEEERKRKVPTSCVDNDDDVFESF